MYLKWNEKHGVVYTQIVENKINTFVFELNEDSKWLISKLSYFSSNCFTITQYYQKTKFIKLIKHPVFKIKY